MAAEHQYKVCRSVIHAGAILWHLRRFSIDAVYDAPTIVLATLTLWAFGIFANKHSPSRHADATSGSEKLRDGKADTETANNGALSTSDSNEDLNDNSDNDNSSPDSILLDWPADDELVQQFIRRGDSMEARLSGVGDLFAPKGFELILWEVSKF